MLSLYADRVLAFDLPAARIAGSLGLAARAGGRHSGFAEVAVAAIAKSRELVVLTLNLRLFHPLVIDALNPFDRIEALDCISRPASSGVHSRQPTARNRRVTGLHCLDSVD
jgi:predicted nucleic acid-binding protein